MREGAPPNGAALWRDLASPDAPTAFRAIQALAASGKDGVGELRKHLRPVPEVSPRLVARWIADLESDEFAEREKATRELEGQGELADPALREKLAARGTPLEVHKRIERLLERPRPLTRDGLRQSRALEALQFADVPEARQLLQALAAGARGARLTREARAALGRLAGRDAVR